MKKRNMLTKVAALSMAALMTVTGLPVAGLDGALKVDAAILSSQNATGGLGIKYKINNGSDKYAYGINNNSTDSVYVGDVIYTKAISGSTAVDKNVTGDAAVLAVSGGASSGSVVKANAAGAGQLKVISGTVTAGVAFDVKKAGKNQIKNLVIGVRNTVTNEEKTAALVTNGSWKTSLSFENMGAGRTEVFLAGAQAGAVNVTSNISLFVDGKAANTADVMNAGEYDLRLAGDGTNVESELATITLKITKNSLSTKANWVETANLQANKYAEYDVNGAKVKSADTIDLLTGAGTKVSDNVVVSAGNVDVSYSGNKQVTKSATMKLAAKASSNLEGTYNVTYTVLGRPLTTANVFVGDDVNHTKGFVIDNQLYTGSQIKPSFDLYDATPLSDFNDSRYATAYEPNGDDHMIVNGQEDKDHAKRYVKLTSSDYTLTYGENNSTDKEGYVVVTGKGNYLNSTSIKLTFKIVDKVKDISNAKVTMSKDGNTLANGSNVIFTGDAITIDEGNTTVEWTDTNDNNSVKPLTNGSDYTVSYENNTDKGTATVKFTGIGDYAGTITKTFNIVAKDLSEKDAMADFSITAQDYSGIAKTPSIKDQVVVGGKTLKEGKDYNVYYDNNVNAGEKAAVTIQGIGNYTGKVVKHFTINAKDFSSVSFDDIENMVYTGSEITPDVVGEDTLGDGSKYTLVKDKDYKLTYTDNIGNADSTYDTANITVEGKNNYTGSTSVSFIIVPAANDLSKAEITLVDSSVEFDDTYHSAVISSVKVGDTVLDNNEFELVKAVSEKEVGTYTVQVKGTNTGSNYYGGIGETSFEITPKAATVDFKLSATKKTYNGKAQSVTVKDVTRDGVEITEDDYTVSGTTKATNAGKNTVTVTLKGNYAGSAKKTWTIAKAKQTIKVSPASKTFKVSKVKKAKQTFTIKVTGAKGTKSFKSNSKKVTVTKAGKVTVKKGTKKGTYKITVKAAATKNYNAAASKTVTIKVK